MSLGLLKSPSQIAQCIRYNNRLLLQYNNRLTIVGIRVLDLDLGKKWNNPTLRKCTPPWNSNPTLIFEKIPTTQILLWLLLIWKISQPHPGIRGGDAHYAIPYLFSVFCKKNQIENSREARQPRIKGGWGWNKYGQNYYNQTQVC